jgi:hypothetical protein
MNVALEDAEEWANGRVTARYGDCFVRGNNGESVCLLGRGLLFAFSLSQGFDLEGWVGADPAVLYISALEDI